MDNKIENKLNQLIAQYSKKLPEQIHHIEMLWQAQKKCWDKDEFAVLHREVHSICGSAGTYGYVKLSQSARQLEIYLKNLLDKEGIDKEDQAQITSYLNQLRLVLTQELPQKIQVLNIKNVEQIENKVIYILEQDVTLGKSLLEQLKQLDYEPYLIQDLIILNQAVDEKLPAAVIIDTYYLAGAGIAQVVEIQKKIVLPIPILCILPNGDLRPRLEAVRANCQAFFQKPLDMIHLTQVLNDICCFTGSESYRILIMDDSESLSEYHALILNQAGMIAKTLTNPLDLLKEMEKFKPHLLLMDLYMPECTGFELAAVLRQEPNYTKIPIIFLSTEDDKDKMLFGISLGGDDFLSKPVSPQHLVSAVRARSKRARILNYYMITDSLTGLLNHSSILNQLDLQLAALGKEQKSLCFVMIDIDSFKKVNDTYGHPVGDMVIKKLSSMLLSRFRCQSNIGRYGGEEFSLILPETSLLEAEPMINKLREQFAQYCFKTEGAEFFVTFSAGIAGFDGKEGSVGLVARADKALYKAKQQGRNQVVVNEWSSNCEAGPE